jgi:hypothetical protein
VLISTSILFAFGVLSGESGYANTAIKMVKKIKHKASNAALFLRKRFQNREVFFSFDIQ